MLSAADTIEAPLPATTPPVLAGNAAARHSKATGVIFVVLFRHNMSNPPRFLKNPAQFLRNPLGLIGSFVALIYGFGVLVSGFSSHLTESQRWVVVGFVIAFPPVVLAAFYRLVTRHHSKLYAPADWRDERHFFGPQTLDQIKLNEKRQILELQETAVETRQERGVERKDTAAEVVERQSRRELLKLIREAEGLARLQLQVDFGSDIVTNVRTTTKGGALEFDAALLEDNDLTAYFDIRLVRWNTFSKQLQRIVKGVSQSKTRLQEMGVATPLYLVVVMMDFSTEDQEKSVAMLSEQLDIADIGLRAYELRELRKRFASSPDDA